MAIEHDPQPRDVVMDIPCAVLAGVWCDGGCSPDWQLCL